jgi:hypothetical protein
MALEIRHHKKVDKKFVVDIFLEACHQNPESQGKWLTLTTRAEVSPFIIPNLLKYAMMAKKQFKPSVTVNGSILLLN